MRPAVAATAAVSGLGVASLAYAWGYERKAFRLRRYDVPVLPPGAPPIRVLHVSDLHATPGQPWKVEWVRALARTEPDLVIDTGDNLASPAGVPVVLAALDMLLDRPGAFVPGSNDWLAPRAKNPARYLLPARGRVRGPGGGWVHVWGGLGRSPHAPVRFACPPEASLLRLVAAGQESAGAR